MKTKLKYQSSPVLFQNKGLVAHNNNKYKPQSISTKRKSYLSAYRGTLKMNESLQSKSQLKPK